MTESAGVTLELGEGFSEDQVLVLLDGDEVWHGTGVTTNYSVGLADVVRLPLNRAATLEVRVRCSATSQWVDAPGGAGEVRLRADLTPDGVLHIGPAAGGWAF